MKQFKFLFSTIMCIWILTSCAQTNQKPKECPMDEDGHLILKNTKWEAELNNVPVILVFNENGGTYSIGGYSYPEVQIDFYYYLYNGYRLCIFSTDRENDMTFHVIKQTPTSWTIKVENNPNAVPLEFKYVR